MTVQKKITRFRAYQLGNAGSSFSYFNGEKFTLIEARYNEVNKESIEQELVKFSLDRIHTLHITSWDQDHCSSSQLEEILNELQPDRYDTPHISDHSLR